MWITSNYIDYNTFNDYVQLQMFTIPCPSNWLLSHNGTSFKLSSSTMSRSSPHKTYFMETQQRRSWAWPVW